MREEQRIGIDQLAAGMYVCRLDCPWTDTPFPLQGFLIDSGTQITVLSRYCREVWIDVERGIAPRDPALGPSDPRHASSSRRPSTTAEALDDMLGRIRYTDTAIFGEELLEARTAHVNAARLTSKILDDIRGGHKLAARDVDDAVKPVVQSVLRNADALFWVNALSKHDSYGYSHAINCCALAAAFGRHLGLPEDMLVDLASGGLLFDVGKARLPADLLKYPGQYNPTQLAHARTHVGLSLQAVLNGDFDRPDVMDMIRTHHERPDGSGYPQGLRGTQIPLFGRMAALIDSFDAMTSDRPHTKALTSHEALQTLYRSRGKLFQEELVEQFIGCLGVYPVGSLVEISGGRVAVVMAQNPARRLRPTIMVLTDADKHLLETFTPLDLMAQAENAPGELQIHIVQPLPTGAYGLDPTELYL